MKVGLLTLQEADNYGAVLQAYGLQTALAHLNVESEFLVFKEGMERKKEISKELDKTFVPLAKRIRAESEKRSAFFEDFRKKNLVRSETIQEKDADKLNRVYDFFIAGSDQIWNFNIPEVDGRYFLPFVNPKKRISYAASFGGDGIPDKNRSWCREQLRSFSALSVREESGRKLIRELTGRDSVVCLDPVFLLERMEWEKLTYKIEEPYVLLHLVQYHKQAVEYVQKLASEKKIGIRVITAGFMYPCGFEPWSGSDVMTWLSLVKHAKYIFTNSFHGIAFSMIFERPFSVIPLGGHLANRNKRIEELLKRAGLERGMNGEAVEISEKELEKRLSGMKKISYAYLKDVLSI